MWILLGAILPAIIYAFIVYLSTPFNSINLRSSLIYCFMGMVSVLLVLGKFIAFPEWSNNISNYSLLNVIFHAFIQVALIEELCKFISYKSLNISKITTSKNNSDLPIAIMFYSMMVSVGFAIVENISYVNYYGHYALVIRSFTAVIVHMLCGLIMGYFIALGRMNTNIKNISEINIFLKRHHKYRILIFSFFGVLASSFYHGLYDFVVVRADNVPSSILLVFSFGLCVSYLMARHLSRESIKIMNKNKQT